MSNACEPSVTVCDVDYRYDVGQNVRLNMDFTDKQTNELADPDTVHITVTEPDLTAKTYNYGDPDGRISRSAEGKYHFEQLLTQSGAYHYRWYSTGHGAGSFQSSLGVKPVGPADCPTPEEERDAAWDEAADTPKRTRGDQGEIEERSADDRIKLDQYNRKRKTSRFAVAQQSVMHGGKYPSCR